MLDGSEGSLAEVARLESIDLSSAEAAEASLAVIDQAIAELDSAQMDLSATQKNELESRRSSLEITAQNLQAAESVRRDADYAVEVANLVTEMIRLNASMALLSHTNIGANSVLKLLGARSRQKNSLPWLSHSHRTTAGPCPSQRSLFLLPTSLAQV